MAYDPNVDYQAMAAGHSNEEIAAYAAANGFSSGQVASALGTDVNTVNNAGYDPNAAGGYKAPATPVNNYFQQPANNGVASHANIAGQNMAGVNPNQKSNFGNYAAGDSRNTFNYDKVSDQQVKDYLAQNPGMSPQQYISGMQQYGVDLHQLSRVTGIDGQQLIGYANQAGITNQDLSRGGILGAQANWISGAKIGEDANSGKLSPAIWSAYRVANGGQAVPGVKYTDADMAAAQNYMKNGYYGTGTAGGMNNAMGGVGSTNGVGTGTGILGNAQPGGGATGSAGTGILGQQAGGSTSTSTSSSTSPGYTVGGLNGSATLGDTTPWNVTADQTVEGRLGNLLNPNDPLQQQARTQALEQMNARGLSNSSMAITAGQLAANQAAIPIAQADAATAAKAAGYNADQMNQANVTQFTAAHQNDLANLDAQTKMASAQMQSDTTRYTANLDATTKQKLAEMQAATSNNNSAYGFATNLYANLQTGIANIQNNPNMDAGAKATAMNNLISVFKNGFDNMTKLNGLTGLDSLMNFSTYDAGTPAAAPGSTVNNENANISNGVYTGNDGG